MFASLSAWKCWFISSWLLFPPSFFWWWSKEGIKAEIKNVIVSFFYLNYLHLIKIEDKFTELSIKTDLPEQGEVQILDWRGILKLLENVLDFFIVPEYSLSTKEVFVIARDRDSLGNPALLEMLELLLSRICFPAVPLIWLWLIFWLYQKKNESELRIY